MDPSVHDVENQTATIELQHLLKQDNEANDGNEFREGDHEIPPRIGDIPSVRKPGYGNWMWAEQQCARRSGFSIAEAKLVQEAYQVYQAEGDPKIFVIEALSEMFEALSSLQHALEHLHKGVNLLPLLDLANMREVTSESHFAVVYGALGVMTRALSADIVEVSESRIHFMQILTKLIGIILESFESGEANPPSLPQDSNEPAEENRQTLSSTAHPVQDATSKSQTQESMASTPAKFPSKAQLADMLRYLEAGHFDLTKLDEKKFKDIIQQLLNSRSCGERNNPGCEGGPGYIIVGWFSRGSLDPREKLLRLNGESDLFKQMRKGIRSMRGWRRFLSLKSLHKFGLYRCDISRGAHIKINLSDQERSILSHFLVAYKASLHHPDIHVAIAWTDWVQRELNASKAILFEGRYSLELIYSWSAVRLSVAVVTPTLFSLAMGLGYMIKTGDVSTAWTISSYIVTAAGAIVALLAILGTLKDS